MFSLFKNLFTGYLAVNSSNSNKTNTTKPDFTNQQINSVEFFAPSTEPFSESCKTDENGCFITSDIGKECNRVKYNSCISGEAGALSCSFNFLNYGEKRHNHFSNHSASIIVKGNNFFWTSDNIPASNTESSCMYFSNANPSKATIHFPNNKPYSFNITLNKENPDYACQYSMILKKQGNNYSVEVDSFTPAGATLCGSGPGNTLSIG
jgi:hypothetical protein